MLLTCQSVPAPAQPLLFLRPTLLPSGGALVYSNNPETITGQAAGAVLYETGGPLSGGYNGQPRGLFRVFFHHLNATGEPMRLVVAVTNPNPFPVDLFRWRTATGSGPGWIGVRMLMDFLAQEPRPTHLAPLAPGRYAPVVNLPVVPGAIATGYADIIASAPVAPLGAPVAVSVLHVRDALPAAVLLPNLPLQPLRPEYASPTTNTSGPIRATARHCSRIGVVVSPDVGRPGVVPVLQVAARVRSYRRNIQPDGQPLPGEYELATDFVDGDIPVFINGNYGVDYTFIISAPLLSPATLELQATCPNEWCTFGTQIALDLNGEIGSCHTAGPDESWPYARLDARLAPAFVLRTSIPGGSCAPARHFMIDQKTAELS